MRAVRHLREVEVLGGIGHSCGATKPPEAHCIDTQFTTPRKLSTLFSN
jgi:hypothetical protein